ncbi:hypothetical protein D3C74_395540 [compost metagenome]
MGNSAATAPLGVTSADSTAESTSMSTMSRAGLVPARSISCWPAHAVMPAASSASATTNSATMRITVGVPKPASDSSTVRTPVR